MEERPKRDGRLRSSVRPGNSFHLLDCERPLALVEGRIVLRHVGTHHHVVEVTAW
jgi:hypothetical protein